MKKRGIIGLLAIAALAFTLAACVSLDDAQEGSTGADLTRPASIFISVDELNALIQEGHPNLVILGVEPGSDTIPGSFILTLGQFTTVGGPYSEGSTVLHSRRTLAETEMILSIAGITADSLVVVYTNAPHNAARMVWELTVLGLDVRYLDGGIPAWVAAGLPTGDSIDMLTADVTPSEFRVVNYRHDEMNISFAEIFHAIQNPDQWLIIDSRTAEEFAGLEARMGRTIAGRIAGSINIDWQSAVVPGTGNHQIRPEAELREIFAPALDGRSVIVFCHGAPRGAHSWMLLKELGVDVYLFNGSWDAWAYALDPANNHPYHELVVQFTEELNHLQ